MGSAITTEWSYLPDVVKAAREVWAYFNGVGNTEDMVKSLVVIGLGALAKYLLSLRLPQGSLLMGTAITTGLRFWPYIMKAMQKVWAYINGGGNKADTVKSLVDIGLVTFAENNCEASVAAGATTALGSIIYDIIVTGMSGQNYGIAKDISNGEYLKVGTDVASNFIGGYGIQRDSQKEKKSKTKSSEKPAGDKKSPEGSGNIPELENDHLKPLDSLVDTSDMMLWST